VYFWRNMLENLFAEREYGILISNVLFLGVGPIVGIMLARVVGRAIDSYGRKPVLVIGTALTLTSVSPWFFAAPDMPDWLLILICLFPPVLGGIAWGAVNMTQMNILLRFADGDGRSRFVAASQLYISISGAVGGLIGGGLTSFFGFLQDNPIRLGPFLWNNWHIAFAASLLMRGVSLTLLRHLHDPGAAPVRVATRAIRTNVFNAVSSGLLAPLRAFGWRRPKQRGNKTDPPHNNHQ